VGIFNWRGRTSEKNFRRRFIASLQGVAPALQCVESAENDLDFSIGDTGEIRNATISLHRAYEEFKQDPSAYDDLFERWRRSLQHLWTPPVPLDPANLVPMIKDRSWLTTNYPPGHEHDCWHEPLNEELIVVYASHDGGFRYPPRSEWTSAGVDADRVRALSLANLRARTPERSVTAFEGVLVIGVGGNFEASQFVDPELWESEVFRSAPDLLVAVPERDLLLASTDISVAAVWELASKAAYAASHVRYPITAQLMIREGEDFRVLDASVVDDNHPIPALDVLDVVAESDTVHRFAIVIATPLAPDPRSAFRLFRKLDGYLNHIGATCKPPLKAEIVIDLHGQSHEAYFALLAGQAPYVASRGAKLVVERSS
jgi:hypothetical protein